MRDEYAGGRNTELSAQTMIGVTVHSKPARSARPLPAGVPQT